jgi:hypothetical protein
MKTSFWLNGPLKFLDEKGQVMEVVDAYRFSPLRTRLRGAGRRSNEASPLEPLIGFDGGRKGYA